MFKTETLDNREIYSGASQMQANQINKLYGGVVVTNFAETIYIKCVNNDDIQNARNFIRATGRTVKYLVLTTDLNKL